MTSQHRAAVLGKPIAHSLSPVLHNAGYAAAGLTGWAYTAIECAESELPGLVDGLGAQWRGLSVTMPLKEVALTVAAAASPAATALGVANTLVRRADGSWFADNTDVIGMVTVLRAAGITDGAAIALLGGGGTARAALGAAARLGNAPVTVFVRRPEAGAELAPVAATLGVPFRVAPWAEAADLRGFDVVVSTVPKGAADHLAAGPHWAASTVYFDVVYHPWPTPLAAWAAAGGSPVVTGLDLLHAQALGQFTQFTGVDAPADAMREALDKAVAEG
ncbi:shikimate dehydrogenase [Catenuloplanes indicus]|uniref:Shikimate dehydrogenase n=1 Tax=Catenuloplanes indicus TaxID=137267 RepID=A0AAE4B0U3_9ACTN|nr:shikimate dehydrogenase [Catenuloplanes indicus]MDQ0369902.1 shikimate dehydrogenase [Catenuloplanes indicus]